MNIAGVVDTITNAMDTAKVPATLLPPFMLKYLALCRSGLSAYKIAAKIIENNKKLGIPTGDNPNGSANLVNEYTYNVVKTFVDALKNDASVQVAIPLQSLLIQATGANAGGPVTCIGTNLMDSIGNGILN